MKTYIEQFLNTITSIYKKLNRKNTAIATCSFLLMLIIFSANEQKDDIHIYFTGDVHCALTENIGYSSLSAYVKKQKAEYKYVTLVDLGDFLQDNAKNSNEDNSISSLTKGLAITEIMNAVGYDIVTIGNHEFDFGINYLARDLENLKSNVIACNLKYVGNLINPISKVSDYVIKDYGGTKVAFIGVTTPETKYKSKDENIKDNNGKILFDFYDRNNGKELYEKVQKVVNETRKNADYVVVLSHLGIDNKEGFSSVDLIENTYGIDVLLDSHSHSVIEQKTYRNMFKKNVVISSAGKSLECFGELVLQKNHKISTSLIKGYDNNNNAIVMDDDIEIVDLLKKIHNKVYGISE